MKDVVVRTQGTETKVEKSKGALKKLVWQYPTGREVSWGSE
ncbi:hypothetical protein [Alkalihalobacillus trypoxylicola]|nr:hypothetical protein [Alkalihalobacillus trypoxylicola]